jgi:hypothetical protein
MMKRHFEVVCRKHSEDSFIGLRVLFTAQGQLRCLKVDQRKVLISRELPVRARNCAVSYRTQLRETTLQFLTPYCSQGLHERKLFFSHLGGKTSSFYVKSNDAAQKKNPDINKIIRVHKIPPLQPILSHLNPVHTLTEYFFKINF